MTPAVCSDRRLSRDGGKSGKRNVYCEAFSMAIAMPALCPFTLLAPAIRIK